VNTRTSWRTGKRVIPVSVPITYDALKAAAVKGKTVGAQMVCPPCGAVGTLVYTGRWLSRWSQWPVAGGIEHRLTPVPECRCTVCKGRLRVLPVELAPRKSYTRPVIETACATYAAMSRPTITLRQTVSWLGKGAPHFTSLHGWLGAMGARALGRLDRQGQGPPVAALIAESAKGLRPELPAEWNVRLSERSGVSVAPRKYRSEQRREQVEGCARLCDAAGRLFPQAAYPWSAWEQWLEARFHVTAWGFPARFRCTAIQHHAPRKVVVPYAPSRPTPACRDGRGAGGGSRPTKGTAHGARGPP